MLNKINWGGTKLKTGATEKAKFFFVDPATGEGSDFYDAQDHASAAARDLLAKRDETGAELFITQIVEVVKSERAFKSSFFLRDKR